MNFTRLANDSVMTKLCAVSTTRNNLISIIERALAEKTCSYSCRALHIDLNILKTLVGVVHSSRSSRADIFHVRSVFLRLVPRLITVRLFVL